MNSIDVTDGQAYQLGAKLRKLAIDAFEICAANEWGRDWESVGCYLHLEVSEYIEAKRDKEIGGDHVSEAADILFVLLSSLIEDSVGPRRLVDALEVKVVQLSKIRGGDGLWTKIERRLNELYLAYNKPDNDNAATAALHGLMKAYDTWID